MPTLFPNARDLITAAQQTDDAAIIIALYGGHLENLLIDAHAAEAPGLDDYLQNISPGEYLQHVITKLDERIDEVKAEGMRDDYIECLENMSADLSMMVILRAMHQCVKDGNPGSFLESEARFIYDRFCLRLQEWPLGKTPPAPQILHLLFGKNLFHTDIFLRDAVKDSQAD